MKIAPIFNDNNTFSIIIPVLNEAQVINQTLDLLEDQKVVPRPEIIVVDGDPAGSTIKVINRPHIKTLTCRPGRGGQMNHGARQAVGRILLFLHADTVLPANAFPRMSATLNSRRAKAGAFTLGIGSPLKKYRWIEWGAALRTRLTQIPYGDQAIFINRSFFIEIGGFSNIPLMEDIELMRRIKKHNKKIAMLPERVWTSARRWEREGALYGTLRNWMLAILYYLGVSPFTLKKYY